MSFLASVGRARPSKNIADVLNTKLNIEQGERRERLVGAQTALSAEHLRQLQRKGQFEQEKHEKMSRQHSVIPMLRVSLPQMDTIGMQRGNVLRKTIL